MTAQTTSLRITVTNTSEAGGTFLTPFWFGFHDESFDLFETGKVASAGLEQLAEDGDASGLAAELVAADADGQGGVVAGAAGPITTGEVTSLVVDVDGASNGQISVAAMILPSNDAFVGTGNGVTLFDEHGTFLGATTLTFLGTDVYDAGTEYNTEEDAAFINQTAPNTGLDEGGVVRLHEGFNGSLGNPDGTLGNPPGVPGAQIILGGTNAFGETIDPIAADFTQPGAEVAEIYINTVTEILGDDSDELIFGDQSDDLVTALDGDDIIVTRAGYDAIDAGDGSDIVAAGRGNDEVSGGDGNDIIRAGSGNDAVAGGEGDDLIFAQRGDDVVMGNEGNDLIRLGAGANTVLFAEGDGDDRVFDFNEDDTLLLDVALTAEDVLAAAKLGAQGIVLDFEEDGSILLVGVTEFTTDSFELI